MEQEPERKVEPEMNRTSGTCYAKVVVSNLLAGSLIGKNGQNINNIRTTTGANMRISTCVPNNNVQYGYYPDRVAKISGTLTEVQQAVKAILDMSVTARPGENEVPNANTTTVNFKYLVPNSSVAMLIGKGGARINELRAQSGAKIHVSNRDEPVYGINNTEPEREVVITGDYNSVVMAANAVCEVVQEDPNLESSMQTNYDAPRPNGAQQPHPAHGYPVQANREIPVPGVFPPHHYGPLHQQHQHQHPQPAFSGTPAMVPPPVLLDYTNQLGLEPYMLERYCEVFLQIPDMYVGMILGKHGQYLQEIKQCSGAKIDISKKGEFVPGTLERLVTVSGNIVSVHVAHARLIKRLAELEHQNGTSPGAAHGRDSLLHET